MTFLQFSFSFLVACLNLGHLVIGQSSNAGWNQVINLNGNMQLNSIVFPDNSKIETFSQSQQQLIVNQNPSPLTANHVVGSTGQPFVQLSQNSMTIQTNNATNLVGAQIELPIDPTLLQQNNVSPDNTFVAMLSPGRQAWVVMEGIKSVNTTDNTVRIVKMTNIDGEYMAIGRQTTETSNVLTPFGTQSVNISGSGIQEVEYADGFRMSMKASQPMTISTDVVNGVSTSMITTQGVMPVNNYRYLVTTNLAAVAPNLNSMVSVVQLPLNTQRVMAMAQSMGIGANEAIVLGVAQRTVLQNPGGATGNLSPNRKRLARRAASSIRASKPAAKASSTPALDPASETAASEPTPTGDATAESTPASNDTASAAEATPTDNAASASTSDASISDATTSDTNASPSTAADPTTSDPATQPDNTPPPSNTNPQSPAATQLLLSPTFTPLTSPTVLDPATGRVMVAVNQINGELILTMQRSAGGQTVQGNSTTAAEGGSLSSQGSQAGVTVTMAQLATLMESQKMGGAFVAGEMMQQFMQSQGVSGLL